VIELMVAVSIAELVSAYSFDEAVVEEAIQQLVKSGHLGGTLRGREYVPHAFSRTQRACVDAFFEQNGYIEFIRAHKLQVSPPSHHHHTIILLPTSDDTSSSSRVRVRAHE